MKPTLPLAGLLLALLSAPVFAQAEGAGRTRLDANGDGAVDRTEASHRPHVAKNFDALDRNKDGRLTADERPRHHGGKHRGGHGGMERMDSDKDGRISRAEFDAGQAALADRFAAHGDRDRSDRKPPEFAAIDGNRDGYLVGSELRAYHERLRPQREAERAARFEARFTEADINRDGKLGRVEVEEKLPQVAQRFAWLDENRDGFLSRTELEAGHGRHRD